MTEIERFLSTKQLYRCDRLDASLTPEQCHTNKQRVANFANDIWDCGPCKGCPGLGEKTEMAKKQYDTCNTPGCTHLAIGSDGLCFKHAASKKQHASEAEKRRKQLEKVAKMNKANAEKRQALKDSIAKKQSNKPNLDTNLDTKNQGHKQKQQVIKAKTVSNEPIKAIDRSIEKTSTEPFVETALSIGMLVQQKQLAYGDSFGKSGDILRTLYPTGIKPDQFDDALCIVRMIDKLFRIATDRDALGEDPFRDICGYSLLAIVKREASL